MGFGVTAFTAFLQSLKPDLASRVVLVYGARTPDLFVYGPLAEACARDVRSLTYVPVCEETHGRLAVEAAWPAVSRLRDPVFYLSGPPPMLDALTTQLGSRAVPRERIRTDAWE
jgi:ferredoxin-NADP reductase